MPAGLRRLNELGIQRFRDYLGELRLDSKTGVPVYLLDDEEHSEPVDLSVSLEDNRFASRFELGKSLVRALERLDQQSISHDAGLWSWIALFYFDQLCPSGPEGERHPAEDYAYILSNNYRHHPRHAIRTTYYFVRNYGASVQFLFSKRPHERGEIVEQLTARQELAACPSVIGAASLLYNDPGRGTFKVGAAGRGRGSINRFIKVLQQFQLTYDLFSTSADQIVDLLPAEFDRFRSQKNGAN